MGKVTEWVGRFSRGAGLAYSLARNLVAYAIAIGVLFYVPWLLAQLVWASPVTGPGIAEKLVWLGLLWGLWYLFVGVIMTPLWYQSWANAALLLDDVMRIYRWVACRWGRG